MKHCKSKLLITANISSQFPSIPFYGTVLYCTTVVYQHFIMHSVFEIEDKQGRSSTWKSSKSENSSLRIGLNGHFHLLRSVSNRRLTRVLLTGTNDGGCCTGRHALLRRIDRSGECRSVNKLAPATVTNKTTTPAVRADQPLTLTLTPKANRLYFGHKNNNRATSPRTD
jgi:hypothetical protein